MLYRNLFGINTLTPSFHSEAEPLFKQIFHHSPTAYTLVDKQGIIYDVNHALCHFSGFKRQEMIGNSVEFFAASGIVLHQERIYWDEFIKRKNLTAQVWSYDKNGKELNQKITITPIDNYFLISHADVSDEMQKVERYRYLAYHDPLTGLANRSLLEDRLEHAISNAARMGSKLCVIFCDLNEFKLLNDDLGHLIGDNTLKEIAERLKSFFRVNDTIARFGGDEFVIIVENLSQEEFLSSLIDRLDKMIRQPLDSGVTISASIGAACFPMDGVTAQHLLNMADTKMYHQKNRFYGLDG